MQRHLSHGGDGACVNLPIRTQQAQASQLWPAWLRDSVLQAARHGGCGRAGLQRPEGRTPALTASRDPGKTPVFLRARHPRRDWPPDPFASAGGCRSQCLFCSPGCESRLSARRAGGEIRQMFIVLRTGAQIAARPGAGGRARPCAGTRACMHACPETQAASAALLFCIGLRGHEI